MKIVIAFYRFFSALFALAFCGLILSSAHVQIGWENFRALFFALVPLLICVLWWKKCRKYLPVRVLLVVLHVIYLIEVIVSLVFLVRQGSSASIAEYAYMSTLGILTVITGVYLVRKELLQVR